MTAPSTRSDGWPSATARRRPPGWSGSCSGTTRRLAFINTGAYDIERYREYARRAAERFDLRYEEIAGAPSLVEKLLYGPWDEECVVVPRGRDDRPSTSSSARFGAASARDATTSPRSTSSPSASAWTCPAGTSLLEAARRARDRDLARSAAARGPAGAAAWWSWSGRCVAAADRPSGSSSSQLELDAGRAARLPGPRPERRQGRRARMLARRRPAAPGRRPRERRSRWSRRCAPTTVEPCRRRRCTTCARTSTGSPPCPR